MYRPLHAYFLLRHRDGVRNVVLVSDGHVNGDEATLQALRAARTHTRLFTCGVRFVIFLLFGINR